MLLINADLRNHDHRHIHGIQSYEGRDTKGLANFLAGSAQLGEIIYRTDIANLSVIPRWERPSNPSELLHSKQMKLLLNGFDRKGIMSSWMLLRSSP